MGSSRSAASARQTNWLGNEQWTPAVVHRPRSPDEIADVVRHAAANGHTVRVVGAGHSWSRVAASDDWMMSLDRMRRVLGVDRTARTITVQGGMFIHELNEALARQGLALRNLGSIDRQTIAGVISTATHGTGARLGTLSSLVRSLELITGTGDHVRCSVEEHPDLFAAARCGIGAVGVIASATLSCVDAFRVQSIDDQRDFDDVLGGLDDMLADNDHVKLWWVPHTGRCLVFRQNATDAPCRRNHVATWIDQRVVRNVVLDAGLRLASLLPRSVPRFNHGILALTPDRVSYVDRSDRVFCFPVEVRHYEAEYAIPIERAGDALRALQRYIRDGGFRVAMVVEVRFVAADPDIWLSPAAGRDSCYINVLQYRHLPFEQYFRGAEAILDAFGARPHWAKLHFKQAPALRPLYPAWDRFLDVRARVDPQRVFVSPYLAELLGV